MNRFLFLVFISSCCYCPDCPKNTNPALPSIVAAKEVKPTPITPTVVSCNDAREKSFSVWLDENFWWFLVFMIVLGVCLVLIFLKIKGG